MTNAQGVSALESLGFTPRQTKFPRRRRAVAQTTQDPESDPIKGGGRVESRVNVSGRCLTVSDVAGRLAVDHETVRRLFTDEPGVIVICNPKKGKRRYRTLRIPEHVYDGVVTRFTCTA